MFEDGKYVWCFSFWVKDSNGIKMYTTNGFIPLSWHAVRIYGLSLKLKYPNCRVYYEAMPLDIRKPTIHEVLL